MSSRQNLEDFTMAHGIGEDAIVQLRSDVQSEGKLQFHTQEKMASVLSHNLARLKGFMICFLLSNGRLT